MADPSWSKHVADILRRNAIRMFATVPDYIVSHVLEHLSADAECRVVTVTREEEGVGLLSGAWLAGRRGALLMQNSGLGNCVNALASLNGTYHFLNRNAPRKLVPFAVAGYAIAFRSGYANLFDYGGGINFWFQRHLGLRVEVRAFQSKDLDNIFGFRFGLSFR